MQVRVLFFGTLKDVLGRASDSLTLPDNAVLGDLVHHYEDRNPRMRHLSVSIAMAVNQEYASPEFPLNDGDEVALLPPVSGGSEPEALPGSGRSYAFLVREKIDPQGVLEGLKRPEDGAAAVFEGVVRNQTRGRRTLYLDYEAYEDMALKRLESLIEQARKNFKIRDAAVVHRLGRLQVGETSVLIVVASAHRAAAFDACRWLIDTLKKTIPIWKKEYFEDGAVWADGEPFPMEIPRAAGTHSERPASN